MKNLLSLSLSLLLTLGLLSVGLLFGGSIASADASSKSANPKAEASQEKTEEKTERKTLTVRHQPLKITFETEGTFVARKMEEVRLAPESWTNFEILEVVPHGATVSQGEVVIRFDGEKLKQALSDLELELHLNELSLMQAEQGLPRKEKSIRDSFTAAERALAEATLAYKNYLEIDRAIMVKGIEMQLKGAQQSTENAREELRQLEKMYEADDLTEETEEIVLKRQRAAVEHAEFSLERAILFHERGLALKVPRSDLDEKIALERAEVAFDRAKTTLDTGLSQARYELEKLKRSRVKSLEKHAKLTSDLSLLTLRAPAAGVVYYGSCTNGKWSEIDSLLGKLQPTKKATANSTLMTIVEPRPLYVVATVSEKNLPSVKVSQAVTVQPTADGSSRIEAKVSKVSVLPVGDDKFSLELDLVGNDQPEWLVAGMTCTAKLTSHENDEALMVPKKAVHSNADDEDEKFVWIADEAGVQRRTVVTGRAKGDNIEIVEGLGKGDVISLDDESKDKE